MRNVCILVPESAKCFIEPTNARNRFAPERHVTTCQPSRIEIAIWVRRGTNVESTPIDFVPVGGEAKDAISCVAGRIVVAGVIDEASNRPNSRVVVETQQRSRPM